MADPGFRASYRLFLLLWLWRRPDNPVKAQFLACAGASEGFMGWLGGLGQPG